MNREEQIIAEAKKYYYDDINCHNAFLHGVEWADEHSADVWHDASEKPLLEKKEIIFLNEQDIAYLTERFGGTFSCMLEDFNWEGFVNLLKISKWAYISDLLPKQFGNSKQLKGE